MNPSQRVLNTPHTCTSAIPIRPEAGSVPGAEFQETVNKSKAMLKAVALAESFLKQ